jgi:hypothetical protein
VGDFGSLVQGRQYAAFGFAEYDFWSGRPSPVALKMTSTVFAETLDNSQHSTWLTTESWKLHMELQA